MRRTQVCPRSRGLTIGACDDDADTTAVWGRLLATDAAVLQKRVTAMANGVCEEDPRSIGERRADALGALANGNHRLACACGSPACPAAGEQPKSNVVIRVIAEQATVDAATNKTPGSTDTQRTAAGAAAGPRGLPAPLLAEAIRTGATIKPIRMPSEEPEPGYRPSAELAEFVRMRDLFCRFPAATWQPSVCDIDHTRPWPLGPTHASNLSCKCRKHHLMKTFWTGVGGWATANCPTARSSA